VQNSAEQRAECVAGESFSSSKQGCSRTWVTHHPSVEQLTATTAACVCGFYVPAGIAKHSSLPTKQAQKETSCIFSVGVYLEVLVHHFLKYCLLSFSVFYDVSALLKTLHVIRACNVSKVQCC